MRAVVRIMPQSGIRDPQGEAIGHALRRLGFDDVNRVRQGKLLEVDLQEADPATARARVDAMCRRLLANPVIEEYEIEIDP